MYCVGARGFPGDKRLVAYVVAVTERAAAPDELRIFLNQRLPDYYPAAFVFIEGLPLTPNGKVDRKALPVPQSDKEATTTGTLHLERLLKNCWQRSGLRY